MKNRSCLFYVFVGVFHVLAGTIDVFGQGYEKAPIEMLRRAGFEREQGLSDFQGIRIGDRLVYYKGRQIGEAIVQKDHVVYELDRRTGQFRDFRLHWRDDLPDRLPRVISREQAAAKAGGKLRYARLFYLAEDCEVTPIRPVPKEPCWIIHTIQDDGQIKASVVDAISGHILGPAVPPPYEGFSLSGPIDTSSCSSSWNAWYRSAENWFNTLGYPTEAVLYPSEAKMREHIASEKMVLFYELAHGGATSFTNGCGDSTSASEIANWLASYTAVPFAFVGSCGGMCSTGPGTLSHAFRKGLLEGTATVGYCGMADEPCVDDCWYAGHTVSWQNKMFEYMSLGFSIKEAFDQANLAYPTCASGNCFRFVGDESLTVVPKINRVPFKRIYVDSQAAGANNGSSWLNAFQQMSDALEASIAVQNEIWVAQGTYRPAPAGGSPSETFTIKGITTLFGGFPAGGGAWEDRDPGTYETILSADLNGDDQPGFTNRTDNGWHVLKAVGPQIVLDGFTIRGGQAEGSNYEQQYGAGLYCTSANLLVRQCRFVDNFAAGRGAGVYLWPETTATFEQCRLEGNHAGQLGGGMVSYGTTTIRSCVFEGNSTVVNGGGFWGKAQFIERSRFFRNMAQDNDGGGIYSIASIALVQCLLASNQAEGAGGGIYACDSDMTVVNCTIAANRAGRQGGLIVDEGHATLMNSIFWGNEDQSGTGQEAQLFLANGQADFCCIQGWTGQCEGMGTIDVDPLFVNAGQDDFHLKSAGGRWDPHIEDWVQDTQTSRCVDAGNPGMDLGEEELRIMPPGTGPNLRINIGAYGGTSEASLSILGWALLADITNDGVVGQADFAILARSWKQSVIDHGADSNRDGFVDWNDLENMALQWLLSTEW
ncbi:MAG: right-handed parallel beta-helix repeat-containing protein [Sedimentisphaerales bacterium]|nr:right-handed parallel beta-helix repeat-containing protein [Sedimentisphaerales bacterium]